MGRKWLLNVPVPQVENPASVDEERWSPEVTSSPVEVDRDPLGLDLSGALFDTSMEEPSPERDVTKTPPLPMKKRRYQSILEILSSPSQKEEEEKPNQEEEA